MATFHEELTNARKAAGLTQQQLADKLHVSRQTVSHWETGRMTPDDDAMAALRQLLPVSTAPKAAAQPTATAQRKMPGWLWLCILGAVCLALILTVRAILPQPVEEPAVPAVVEATAEPAPELTAAPEADATAEPQPAATAAPVLPADYPLSWYQNQPANEDTAKAYVDVVPHRLQARLMETGFGEDPRWDIGFDVVERNGIDFHPEKMTLIQFTPEGGVYSTEVIAARELSEYVDAELNQDNPYFEWRTMSCDYEAGWYGLALEGVDANGNALAFGDVIQLLDEPQPMPVKADFFVEQVPVSGKPFLTITAKEGDTIHLTPGAHPYTGDPAYLYTQLVTNSGDAPLNVISYQIMFFNGEERFLYSDNAGESFARWCGETSTTIQPGQTWVMETFEPDIPADLICYCIVGETEDGEEMRFMGYLHLSAEAKP